MRKPFIHALAFAGVLGGLAPQAMAAPAALTAAGAADAADYAAPAFSGDRFAPRRDLSGYVGGGPESASFALLSAPDGTAKRAQQAGGLNAEGCDNSGAGFACITQPDDRRAFEPDDVDADENEMGGFVSLVPEPATCVLMVAGLGALGFGARRRRQNQ